MKRDVEKQLAAKRLRSEGWSIVKIAKRLDAAKSSVSLWTRNINLTQAQKDKLRNRIVPKTFICKRCGKENVITRRNRSNQFCNVECYFGHQVQQRKKGRKSYCTFCGLENRRPSAKFCSFDCSVKHHWRTKISTANGTGKSPSNQASAKTLVINMRGHKCEVCGNTMWRGEPIPLILDHINGIWNDWRLENLRLVCGNCDMQLPTYKSKNKGRGRVYNREYYHRAKERCDNGIRPDLKSGAP